MDWRGVTIKLRLCAIVEQTRKCYISQYRTMQFQLHEEM